MKKTIKEAEIIWKYLKPYKKQIYFASVFALITTLISAIIPYLYGRLVDSIPDPQAWALLLNLLIIWLLMNIVSVFSKRISGIRGSVLGVNIFHDFILKAASHLINLPLSFHKEKKSGEIFSKIDRAADYLVRITDEVLIWFFPQFLSALFGILILFFVQPQLAWAALVLFLGYILISINKTQPIIRTQEKLSQRFEEVFGSLYDSFFNVQTIKSCSAERFQKEKTDKDFSEKLGPVYKNFTILWHFLHFWQNLFFSFGFVLVFGFSIFLLKENVITPGKLVMFLGYLNLIHSPLMALAWYWQQFRTGITAIKRAEEFLEIPEEDFNEKGKILKDVKGKVKFKNVNFGYLDSQLVLENINFIVSPGEKIALVGGSGEGKTTLVDLISLYFKPTSGQILIDNINIKDLNLHSLRKIIAYVPQEITLFNDTVRNNILYGKPEADDDEIVKTAKIANAHQFIKSFPQKYNTLVGERGVKLSVGQKQRIAIARALIRDPKILILDEATSSLDSESEKLVQDALEKLIQNRTTFIIAHRLSTIRKADKILVLEKGKIVEEGTHEELIKKRRAYFKFYSLQFHPSL